MKWLSIACLLAGTLVLSGCPKDAPPKAPQQSSLAKWFIAPPKGCAAGTYEFKGNLQSARDGANTRAARELARSLEQKIQGMIKDYMSEGAAEGEEFSEELVTNVSRNIVNRTVSGVRPVDGALDADRYYALVCLDPEVFAEALAAESDLKDKLRTGLNERAKVEFEDLDAQIEKIQGSSQ